MVGGWGGVEGGRPLFTRCCCCLPGLYIECPLRCSPFQEAEPHTCPHTSRCLFCVREMACTAGQNTRTLFGCKGEKLLVRQQSSTAKFISLSLQNRLPVIKLVDGMLSSMLASQEDSYNPMQKLLLLLYYYYYNQFTIYIYNDIK